MPEITHADVVAFADERVNLKSDDVQEHREQVNRLRDKLAVFIKDHPDVGLIKMLLSGSLAKGTALSALNDIDVAVYVDAGKAPSMYDRRSELLQWLADRLKEAYPQMKPEQIAVQTHTVRISFRGSGLDVEVAPVFYTGLPNDRGYLLNRHTGQPLLTSIPLHLEFIRKRKAAQPQHFVQVIRLIKWWARTCKGNDEAFRCRSFMLEMICAHLAPTVDMSNYPSALEAVFAYVVRSGLETRISFNDYYSASKLPKGRVASIEIFDPVNEANNVTQDYTQTDQGRLVTAAEDAIDALAEARFATTKSRAQECWRRVFGPSFMR